MTSSLNHIISEIQRKENAVSLSAPNAIDEAYQMTIYLKEYLWSIREDVTKQGFKNQWEEINFFRNIKPYILSKLIYHNKIFRIQTACPVDGGKMYASYFSEQIKELKQEYREHIYNSDFYRYYRSGRTDRDETYFRLGNINFHDGLNSFVFEIDPLFSTYYDNKVARIIANELLYTYLLQKINDDEMADFSVRDISDGILWTDTKNALIELIYALYANSSLSNGKIRIRKISLVLEKLFQITLGDLHHSFHRMKYRAGSRTTFLDQLKSSLEEYMDKDL
ncbi:RteC domain-containing protein [uncultured Chryseobacterium sp.]|jgi:RteC protein.|uniref:RteC domain-containing protein n=1 Tax=uncultured Chryseobacterium sp. TaxID=259322 RepID=UPI002616E7A8|nr:RteC domain-containing protein [uncultured Chryseobacterium sp.]